MKGTNFMISLRTNRCLHILVILVLLSNNLPLKTRGAALYITTKQINNTRMRTQPIDTINQPASPLYHYRGEETLTAGVSTPIQMVYGLGNIYSVDISNNGKKALLGSAAGFAILLNLDNGKVEKRLFGHSDSVSGVSFSPDETKALTGSGPTDGNIKLWDLATGRIIWSINPSPGYWATGVFSPNGQTVLISCYNKVQVVDAATAQVLREFTIDFLNGAIYSPDGSIIAITTGYSYSNSGKIYLYSGTTGLLLQTLEQPGNVYGISFSQDGKKIITGSQDPWVRVWNVETGEIQQLIGPFNSGGASILSFSPDGREALLINWEYGQLQIWDPFTGSYLRELTSTRYSGANDAVYSSDGKYIIAGMSDGYGAVVLYDAASGGQIRKYGQSGYIYSVAVSPDGLHVATGYSYPIYGLVKIWNKDTGDLLYELQTESSEVTCLKFSPDGKYLLSGDRNARLWSVDNGTLIRTFSTQYGFSKLKSVDISSDMKMILTSSDDNRTQLWNMMTGVLITNFTGSVSVFSPDGKFVLTGGNYYDRYARIYKIDTGIIVQTFYHGEDFYSVGFSPDGSEIMTSGHYLQTWDVVTGIRLRVFDLQSGQGYRQSYYAADGRSLYAINDYGLFQINVSDGLVLQEYRNIYDIQLMIRSFTFTPDGTQLLFSGETQLSSGSDQKGHLTLLLPATAGKLRNTSSYHSATITSATYSPDGMYVLTTGDMGDNTAKVIDIQTSAVKQILTCTGGINQGEFSPDGKYILTGGMDNKATIWDIENGSIIHEIAHSNPVGSVGFSPDGSYLITADTGGRVYVRQTGSFSLVTEFQAYDTYLDKVHFSPDGTKILTAGKDSTNGALYSLKLWNTQGSLIRIFTGHSNYIKAIAFSPDGRQILSGSEDKTARLWDVETGRLTWMTGRFNAGFVRSVVFSPDGRLIAISAGSFGFIFDASTGDYLLSIQHPYAEVSALSFSLRETALVSGGTDGKLNSWELDWAPWGSRQALPLTLDIPVDNQVSLSNIVDFKLEMIENQPLLVEVIPQNNNDTLWFYGKYGELPNLAIYDTRSLLKSPNGSYQILIEPTRSGTYFFSVYGQRITLNSAGFQIKATIKNNYLSDVSPKVAGNTGNTHFSLKGLGFLTGIEVGLRAAGLPTYMANSIDIQSPTMLEAVINLSSATPGKYDLLVSWPGGQSSILPSIIEIQPGMGGILQASFSSPALVRPGQIFTAILSYNNAGDSDLTSPLFIISNEENVPMRLSENDPFTPQPIQVLGIGTTSSKGILSAGAMNYIPIYFRVPDNFGGHQFIHFKLETMVADDSLIDWITFEQENKPPDIDPQVWSVIFTNLKLQIGNTWLDYGVALSNDATYQGSLGRSISNVKDLFNFEIRKAAGLTPKPFLAKKQDVTIPAPGLSFQFERIFPTNLESRFNLGVFGQGWTHNYDIYIEAQSNGDIRIHWPNSGWRFFRTDGAGSYSGKFGEKAILSVSGGNFILTEKEGVRYQFRSDGYLDRIEDLHGNQILAEYDAPSKLSKLRHTNGDHIDLTYNAQGTVENLTDQNGLVTVYSYDPSNHLTSVTAPGGRMTQYTYNQTAGDSAEHVLLSISYPDNTHLYYAYDGWGRLIGEWKDGNSEKIQYAYDLTGKIATTNSIGETSYIYLDEIGRITRLKDALGQQITLSFDHFCNCTQITTPDGQPYQLTFDLLCNPISAENPLGLVQQITYDTRFSQLGSLRDGRGNELHFNYDDFGNLVTISYPDGSQEIISYNTVGKPKTYQDRTGRITTLSFNVRGQLTRKDYPDGSWLAFSYDPHGNLSQASDPAGTINMSYDRYTRWLTGIQYPTGQSFTYEYNANGQRTRRIANDGKQLVYTYDLAGRLSQINDESSNLVVKYTYDLNGRTIQKKLGNGTYSNYEYDTAGQVIHLLNYSPSGIIQSRFDYLYDVLGNRTSMTTLEGVTGYHYDVLGQLTSVDYPDGRQVSYYYDETGNRTQVIENGVEEKYQTNPLNQYTQVGNTLFTYDLNGNLMTQFETGKTWAYFYDYENRLVRVDTPTGSVSYAYNALGQRTSRTDANGTVQYIYDGIHVAYDLNQSNSITARYVFGNEIDEILQMERNGQNYHYQLDALGSVRGLTDSSGNLIESYEYDAFGLPSRMSSIGNPWYFTGREYDVHSELQYNRTRYYHPLTGRFIHQDLLRVALYLFGNNLYSYVNNNPTIYTDPYGLINPVLIAIGLVAIGAIGLGVQDYMSSGSLESGINTSLTSLSYAVPGSELLSATQAIPDMVNILTQIQNKNKYIEELLGYEVYPSPFRKNTGTTISENITPLDPNEKLGPAGTGNDQIIDGINELPYSIYFENISTATAPAQQVVIIDYLDPDLDLSTLKITEIAFGNYIIPISETTIQYTKRVTIPDWRSTVNKSWWVDIQFDLNIFNGRMRWILNTIDPETGKPPTDVLAGFLPPNDGTGRGAGHVSYSILPKNNLPCKTTITNTASITFDTEVSISTNTVTNTIWYITFNDRLFLPIINR